MKSNVDSSLPLPSQPFDGVAPGYDAGFTNQRLGGWLRDIVRDHLADTFTSGQHVLELGCGTGEDAVWLAQRGIQVTATDASPAMLTETRRKVANAGVGDLVTVAELHMNIPHPPGRGDIAISPWSPPEPRGWKAGRYCDIVPTGGFDGALSNFGPLNCVADRPTLFSQLAEVIRPGGRLVLVVMGPVCPWEISWFVGHGQFGTARRRFRNGAMARIGESAIQVWYPSQRRLRRELAPDFRTLSVAGVGLLLPPSEMGGLVERAPRLAERMARIDRRMAQTLPWRWLNDHYLLVAERR